MFDISYTFLLYFRYFFIIYKMRWSDIDVVDLEGKKIDIKHNLKLF